MKEKRMMMMERSTGKTVHDTAGHSRFTLLLLQLLLGHDSLYTQSQSLIKHSRVSRELVVPSSVRVTSTTAAAAGQKILQREECCLCVCASPPITPSSSSSSPNCPLAHSFFCPSVCNFRLKLVSNQIPSVHCRQK